MRIIGTAATHSSGNLGRLLIENLTDEVLSDRVAADIKRPRRPKRHARLCGRHTVDPMPVYLAAISPWSPHAWISAGPG